LVAPADTDETPLKRAAPPARFASGCREGAGGGCKQSGYILSADTVVACGRRLLPKAQTEGGA
jgi:septum formation protein